MRHCTIPKNQLARCLLPIACAALAMSLTASLALVDQVTPPSVPTDLQVEPGNKAFLKGHATGTQNYICLPEGTGFKFILFTPQATLFDEDGKQIISALILIQRRPERSAPLGSTEIPAPFGRG